MENEELLRTPLYQSHLDLGARMVEFGGWCMPVQYSGVVKEHLNVRQKVGIFDVSHMGQISVRGQEAEECLNFLCSNDVSKIDIGRAQYTVLLTEEGTPVDDLIIYKMAECDFLLCVNASNIKRDFDWIVRFNKFQAEVMNQSQDYALIAIQGPLAEKLCQKILVKELGNLPYFCHQKLNSTINNVKLSGFIARTGYTGEEGFEIFLHSSQAVTLWDALLEEGESFGLLPIGLGARDSLRLEAGLCLYGHELREDIDIISAGLGWVTKLSKGNFIGREALTRIKELGSEYKLVGIELLDAGIAREGTVVTDLNGHKVGFVTSGTRTPTVNKSIALSYIRSQMVAELDKGLYCVVRDKPIRGKIVTLPFYKRAK